MEKIDLTKCNNCRYKAKIDGIVTTGIVSAKDGINAFLKNEQGYNVGCLTGAGLVDSDNRPITDFEIVPRDPETYQDWQVGDKIIRNANVGTVIFRYGEVVLYKYEETDVSRCCTCPYICEELFHNGYRLVLTDIEKQIIEKQIIEKQIIEKQIIENKKYEPQDGDICFASTGPQGQRFIIIYKDASYSLADLHGTGWKLREGASWGYSHIRLATDEERQILFDALAKKGKRWNAEKKVVESIQEPEELRAVKSEIKSDITHEFKKGEPVLVRDYGGFWVIKTFTKMQDSYCKYMATTDGVDDCGYRECIPYNERTMHLLGTTEDYKGGG